MSNAITHAGMHLAEDDYRPEPGAEARLVTFHETRVTLAQSLPAGAESAIADAVTDAWRRCLGADVAACVAEIGDGRWETFAIFADYGDHNRTAAAWHAFHTVALGALVGLLSA